MKDDFKLLRGFADGQTNEQTFVIVELLSQLKKLLKAPHAIPQKLCLDMYIEDMNLI